MKTFKYPVHGFYVSCNEFPTRIAVGIEMGSCIQYCIDCHSKDLWDTQDYMTLEKIQLEVMSLLEKGATGIVIMGGTTNNIHYDDLVKLINTMCDLAPTCLYSGSDDEELHRKLVEDTYLVALKTGSYIKELGGLSSPTTNQHFYLLGEEYDYNAQGGLENRRRIMRDVTKDFFQKHDQFNIKPKERQT